MGEALDRLGARWLDLVRDASPQTWARIVDILEGVSFDAVVDGEAVRLCGEPHGIVIVPGAGGTSEAMQVRVTRAALVAIARGDLTLAEAERTGAIEYFAGDTDTRTRLRTMDRAEAAWRIFVSSEAARRVQAELLAGATPDPSPTAPPPRATVVVPTVTVFGAGVTGLTAAMELVERGFRVQVVEREPAARGRDACEVGGMARTQVVRLPTLAEPHGDSPTRSSDVLDEPYGDGVSSMVSTEPTFELHEHVDFRPGDTRVRREGLLDSWGRTNGDRIDAMVAELRALVQVYDEERARRIAAAQRAGAVPDVWEPGRAKIRILVGGHVRGHRPPPNIALRRARAVIQVLTSALGPLAERFELLPEAVEDREPWSDAAVHRGAETIRADRVDRVDLRVLEERIAPGEHGYRFFPAFYRNLFHTMKRIPLFDDKGRETGRTAYDNLVATEALLLVPFEGQGAVEVPRRRIHTIEGLRRVLRGLYERLNFAYHDIALFEIRLFKFMTSCWQRRRQVAREHSWREYIGVADFSPQFQAFLLDAPQALVAMNAEEIDARTHGNISVQLLLDQLGSGRQSDMTLNGPTTNAFLKPWKDYLKHHGVRFFLGQLRGVTPTGDGRMAPVVGRSDRATVPAGATVGDAPIAEGSYAWEPTSDYYVLATPLEEAWRFVGDLPVDQLDGELATLRRWYDGVRREIRDELGSDYLWTPGHDIPRRADHHPVGPLRDFAGLQFYFNYALQMGASGHIYYVGTPWGLSSFNQPPFWRVRRVLERHRYLAGISIDIGKWYTHAGLAAAHPDVHTAIGTPPLPLAQETWRQILAGFGPEYASLLRAPNWYHLDDTLTWDPARRRYVNGSPFLINRPEDWDRRPGQTLKELLADGLAGAPSGWDADEVAEARRLAGALPHGAWYRMSWGQWVPAGTYMRTHTRMTTMEAANESARHAVNRILHHLAHRPRTGAPASAGVLMGDYCPTWDVEEHELEDLEPMKRLDARLYERGLPHIVDVLGLEKHVGADAEGVERLRGLLDAARDFAGGATPAGGGWMAEVERELRRWMG